MSETYVALFLDLGVHHQMVGLRDCGECPPGVEFKDDGCVVWTQGQTLDGYTEIEPGIYMPTIDECRDRITALKTPFQIQYFCMSPGCDSFQGVVTAAQCGRCELRRGRNVG